MLDFNCFSLGKYFVGMHFPQLGGNKNSLQWFSVSVWCRERGLCCVCVNSREGGGKKRESKVRTLKACTSLAAHRAVFSVFLCWDCADGRGLWRSHILDHLLWIVLLFSLWSFHFSFQSIITGFWGWSGFSEWSGDAEDQEEEASSEDQHWPHQSSSSVSNRVRWEGQDRDTGDTSVSQMK